MSSWPFSTVEFLCKLSEFYWTKKQAERGACYIKYSDINYENRGRAAKEYNKIHSHDIDIAVYTRTKHQNNE